MTLIVYTDELVAASAALRHLGDRVASFGHQLDHRVGVVAIGIDNDVGSALTRAWDDVARAIDDLAEGFGTYGMALEQIAEHYHDVDRALAGSVPP